MKEMDRYQARLRVRRAALRRLGATNIRCICGETDPVCFEPDHIYRREHDGTCWGLCKNCHAKRTARGWSEHPPVRPEPPRPFARLGHMLLGVADYLSFIVEHLTLAAEIMFKLDSRGITLED
jgi:hypothetical protein